MDGLQLFNVDPCHFQLNSSMLVLMICPHYRVVVQLSWDAAVCLVQEAHGLLSSHFCYREAQVAKTGSALNRTTSWYSTPPFKSNVISLVTYSQILLLYTQTSFSFFFYEFYTKELTPLRLRMWMMGWLIHVIIMQKMAPNRIISHVISTNFYWSTSIYLSKNWRYVTREDDIHFDYQ